jgi:hypothetical protein
MLHIEGFKTHNPQFKLTPLLNKLNQSYIFNNHEVDHKSSQIISTSSKSANHAQTPLFGGSVVTAKSDSAKKNMMTPTGIDGKLYESMDSINFN